jgi:hypothetical protein
MLFATTASPRRIAKAYAAPAPFRLASARAGKDRRITKRIGRMRKTHYNMQSRHFRHLRAVTQSIPERDPRLSSTSVEELISHQTAPQPPTRDCSPHVRGALFSVSLLDRHLPRIEVSLEYALHQPPYQSPLSQGYLTKPCAISQPSLESATQYEDYPGTFHWRSSRSADL